MNLIRKNISLLLFSGSFDFLIVQLLVSIELLSKWVDDSAYFFVAIHCPPPKKRIMFENLKNIWAVSWVSEWVWNILIGGNQWRHTVIKLPMCCSIDRASLVPCPSSLAQRLLWLFKSRKTAISLVKNYIIIVVSSPQILAVQLRNLFNLFYHFYVVVW